jgi:hypothetical protein
LWWAIAAYAGHWALKAETDVGSVMNYVTKASLVVFAVTLCLPAFKAELRGHKSLARRRDDKTTRPRDHATTGPLDHQTTRLQDHQTTRPRDHETTGPRDYRTTGPRDHGTTGPLTMQNAEKLKARNPRSHCRINRKEHSAAKPQPETTGSLKTGPRSFSLHDSVPP